MEKFIYNWLNCAFGRRIAENPKGYAMFVIASYIVLC
jgi:hypothetical protein